MPERNSDAKTQLAGPVHAGSAESAQCSLRLFGYSRYLDLDLVSTDAKRKQKRTETRTATTDDRHVSQILETNAQPSLPRTLLTAESANEKSTCHTCIPGPALPVFESNPINDNTRHSSDFLICLIQ